MHRNKRKLLCLDKGRSISVGQPDNSNVPGKGQDYKNLRNLQLSKVQILPLENVDCLHVTGQSKYCPPN